MNIYIYSLYFIYIIKNNDIYIYISKYIINYVYAIYIFFSVDYKKFQEKVESIKFGWIEKIMGTFHKSVDDTANVMKFIAKKERRHNMSDKWSEECKMQWMNNRKPKCFVKKTESNKKESVSKSNTPKPSHRQQRRTKASKQSRMESAMAGKSQRSKPRVARFLRPSIVKFINYKEELNIRSNWDQWKIKFKYWYIRYLFEVCKRIWSEDMHLYTILQHNPNYPMFAFKEIPQLEPYAQSCMSKIIAMVTNGGSERSVAKLTKICTGARNRMHEDTLNNHDKIKMRVIEEYSESDNTATWAEAPQIIEQMIEKAKIQSDFPRTLSRCKYEIKIIDQQIGIFCLFYIYIYISSNIYFIF